MSSDTPVRHVLPLSLPPRGLSRIQAAAYIGVSPSMFDAVVIDGRLPRPKQINARTVWDRHKVDECFSAVPEKGSVARIGAAAYQAEPVDDYDPWSNLKVGDPDEMRKFALSQWERAALFALLDRGGKAKAQAIAGAGPLTQKSLSERGLVRIVDGMLEVTAEGTAIAKNHGHGGWRGA